MKTIKYSFLFLALAALIASCGSDPDPLAVSSITAAGTSFEDGSQITSDLNGSSSAEGVALNATITITMDRMPTTASVNATNVKITSADGTVDAAVSLSGSTITVDPTNDFDRGTLYTLTVNSLVAEDEGALGNLSRTFTTEGRAAVVVPNEDAQEAYWTFDGNTAEANNAYTTANEIEVTYTEDRFGQGASCLSFDGAETLVEIGNGSALMETNDFTLSFWMKSDGSIVNENGETRGQFVMGLGAWNGFQFEIFGNYGGCKLASSWELSDGNAAGQDIWWSTNGDLGWMGWTFDQDVSQAGGLAGIIKDKWAHVLISYDAETKVSAMYINGVLRKSQDYNLYGAEHALYNAVGMKYNGNDAPGDRLALGFIQGSENRAVTDDWANPIGFPDNNHFKGQMDDLRIFHASFSQAEVEALYNAEKP